MLTRIGFITVVTATVTSAFVEASQQRTIRAAGFLAEKAADVESDLGPIDVRLNQIE